MWTPSQTNVWLWILQRSPIVAPRWISTNGPTVVPLPTEQPYRFVNGPMRTPSPRETSSRSLQGASLAGRSAIEVRAHTVYDGSELCFVDAREDRERQALARQRFRDREGAPPIAEAR